MRVEDITPETLDQVAAEWEENRITNLVRDSVVKLGYELRLARRDASHAEVRAKIRAMRLYHQHDVPKKEIAELLGLELREVNKWLK